MATKTYTVPNPEDFNAGDCYLRNGQWYQDIEEPETRLEGKLIEDDELLDQYATDVAELGPLQALAHFLDRVFQP